MRHIVKHYKQHFKGKCLDIGTKEGECLKLMPKGSVGIDIIKPTDLEGYTTLQHDLNTNRLPFKDNEFDFILFSHVIEHINSPSLLLKECYRVLKPKGRMIIAAPQFVPWNRGNYIKYEHGHKYFWTPKTFKHTLRMHDFKILKTWVNYFPGFKPLYYLFQYTPLRLIAKDIHILCKKDKDEN